MRHCESESFCNTAEEKHKAHIFSSSQDCVLESSQQHPGRYPGLTAALQQRGLEPCLVLPQGSQPHLLPCCDSCFNTCRNCSLLYPVCQCQHSCEPWWVHQAQLWPLGQPASHHPGAGCSLQHCSLLNQSQAPLVSVWQRRGRTQGNSTKISP